MDIMSLPILLIFVAVLVFVLSFSTLLWPMILQYVTPKGQHFWTKIDHIPGPPTIPIFGNALSFIVSKERMMEILDELSKKYFPVYKVWSFGKAVVCPIGAEHVEAILHSSKNIEKGELYNLLHPWLGYGLLTSTGEKWHSHRKLLTPAFHFKILEKFIPVFTEKSKTLVKDLSIESRAGNAFNIVPYISRCTLEVICESAMGIKLDRNDGAQQEYVKAIHGLGDVLYQRVIKPWLMMEWLFACTPLAFKQRKCLKILHNFTDKVIQEKKREYITNKLENKPKEEEIRPQKRKIKAFLDLLVEVSLEQNLLTDEEIREEVDTFMFEGHDTTAMAICWTLFCLANNPKIQEQVWEEVEEGLKHSAEASDDDLDSSIVNMLYDMPLMERCIKESLRLYPSVPFIARTVTEELQMGDYKVPEKTMVHMFVRNIHRNPSIYPDPEKFNPDRFLPDATKSRHPYAYVPFSAGPRNCIGQRFAMLEMKSIISEIIHKYKIIAIDTPETVSVIIDLVLRSPNGIKIKLEPR